MRYRSFVMVAVSVALLAQALPAKGCTCAPPGDAREELQQSEAAFIGTVLSQRPDEDDQGRTAITFRVDEEIKGDFGETVDVYTATEGSMCGLTVADGTGPMGLLLSYDETTGRWGSSGCSVRDPERLRRAAAPLPEPDGHGPARALLGGNWGEVEILASDARGRTLGYGLGDHEVVDLEVCPRARTFVTLERNGGGHAVALRRLGTNALLWEAEVGGRWPLPVALGCTGGRDRDVYVATRSYDRQAPEGSVVRYHDDRRTLLYQGSLFDAEFGPRGVAYLQGGRRGGRITRLDLRTLSRSFVGRTPPGPAPLTVSPDGSRLATFAGGALYVFDLAEDTVVSRELTGDTFGETAWFRDGAVGYFPRCSDRRRIEVFDVTLRDRRRLPGRWCAEDFATSGKRAWGVAGRTLRKVTMSRGAWVVRKLPTRALRVVAAIPGDVHVDWAEP
jgi:hypothetical protein